MLLRARVFVIFVGISLFLFIVELVRRRKMREEYSWLWLLAGVTICALSIWNGVIIVLARMVGAVYEPSVLFFFSLVFIALINIFYAIKLSALTEQVKNMAQKIALLEIKKEKEGS